MTLDLPFLCFRRNGYSSLSSQDSKGTPRSHLEGKSKNFISISASSFKAPGRLALGPADLGTANFTFFLFDFLLPSSTWQFLFIYFFSCQTDGNYSLCIGICHHFLDCLYFPHSSASRFFSPTLAPPRLPPFSPRVRLAGMKISRPPTSVGHYKMVKHRGDKGNEENPHR